MLNKGDVETLSVGFTPANEYNAENTPVTLTSSAPEIVSVNEDIDRKELQMPFQVAYAVSIHKAQGLEYDSVKIVITNEVEKRITHNIFYTAITRTKNKLKIYWSPETQERIISNFNIVSDIKDAMILAKKNNLMFRKIKAK